VRRTVVAMTPMMDIAASRSVRLPTSAWPGRGVGDDGSNGPFDELQDHLTNDPSNRNRRRGQVHSGLLIECSDGVRRARRFGGVSRGG
jgi:hypothetical protein